MAFDPFDEYQVIEELPRLGSLHAYRVRAKSGQPAHDLLLSIFEPDPAFVDEHEAGVQIEQFLRRARRQQQLSGDSANKDHWVPVWQADRIERGQYGAAYSVVDYCPLTPRRLAGTASADDLLQIISGALEALHALHESSLAYAAADSHEDALLVVLIDNPVASPRRRVRLSRIEFEADSATASHRAADLRAVARLILLLVTGENHLPATNHVAPTSAWKRANLRGTGDKWLEICNRLAAPDLARNLPDVRQLITTLPFAPQTTGHVVRWVKIAVPLAIVLTLLVIAGSAYLLLGRKASSSSSSTTSTTPGVTTVARKPDPTLTLSQIIAKHAWIEALCKGLADDTPLAHDDASKLARQLIECRSALSPSTFGLRDANASPADIDAAAAKWGGKDKQGGRVGTANEALGELRDRLEKLQSVLSDAAKTGIDDVVWKDLKQRLATDAAKLADLARQTPDPMPEASSSASATPAAAAPGSTSLTALPEPLLPTLQSVDVALMVVVPVVKKELHANLAEALRRSAVTDVPLLSTSREKLMTSVNSLLGAKELAAGSAIAAEMNKLSALICDAAPKLDEIKTEAEKLKRPEFQALHKRVTSPADIDSAQRVLKNARFIDALWQKAEEKADNDPTLTKFVRKTLSEEFDQSLTQGLAGQAQWLDLMQREPVMKSLQSFLDNEWSNQKNVQGQQFDKQLFVKLAIRPSGTGVSMVELQKWIDQVPQFTEVTPAEDTRARDYEAASKDRATIESLIESIDPDKAKEKGYREKSQALAQRIDKLKPSGVLLRREATEKLQPLVELSRDARALLADVQQDAIRPADWLAAVKPAAEMRPASWAQSPSLAQAWDDFGKWMREPARVAQWQASPASFHTFRSRFAQALPARLEKIAADERLAPAKEPWPSDAMTLATQRREDAIKSAITSLTKAGAEKLLDSSDAEFAAALSPSLDAHAAWRSSVSRSLALAASVHQAFASALDLNEPLTSPDASAAATLDGTIVALRKEPALADLSQSPSIKQALAEHESLVVVQSLKPDALIARVAASDAPLAVRLSAYRRLGKTGWPASVVELQAEAQHVKALSQTTSTLPPARAEVIKKELSVEARSRWTRCLLSAKTWDERDGAMKLRSAFGSDETLLSDPSVKWAARLLSLRSEALAMNKANVPDDKARESLLSLSSDLSKEFTGPSASIVAGIAKLTTSQKNSGDSTQSLLKAGPGKLGWTAQASPDGAWVKYSVQGHTLSFVRFEASPDKGVPKSFYLCTSELSVWAFAELFAAASKASKDKMLELGKEFPPFEDCRVRSWQYRGDAIAPADNWLELTSDAWPRLDPAQRKASPPDIDAGSPTANHPVQAIGPKVAIELASVAGCRLPSVAEWKLAQGPGEINPLVHALRGRKWLSQKNHAMTSGSLTPPSPDRGIFQAQANANKPAPRAADQADGVIWFKPVASDSTGAPVVENLIGNVAELVLDSLDTPESTSVIGGSSLSSPEDPLDQPLKPRRYTETGWVDVGLRLSFTAPIDPLAAQWAKLFADDNAAAYWPGSANR
jgi:hypothetical protein